MDINSKSCEENDTGKASLIVFEPKVVQTCSFAFLKGVPVLLLSETKEPEVKLEYEGPTQQIKEEQQTCRTTDLPKVKNNITFRCNVEGCGKGFSSQSYLREHQIVQHEGQRMLKCSIDGCDRTFSWPAHLRYHEKSHLGERDAHCPVEGCGAQFLTRQRLRIHMRTHTGHRPFKCDQCDKNFLTAGNLKNHVRTHTGERPFKCPEEACYRRFAELSSLKKHMLTHTGDKPYKCNICGRGFTQAGSRNVHVKRHNHGHKTDFSVKDSLLSEPVIFSNSSVDKVVTVITEPTDEADASQPELDIIRGDMNSVAVSSSANVVVLSQPEEIVTLATGLHTDQEISEEIIYDNTLLHNEFDHEEIASNFST